MTTVLPLVDMFDPKKKDRFKTEWWGWREHQQSWNSATSSGAGYFGSWWNFIESTTIPLYQASISFANPRNSYTLALSIGTRVVQGVPVHRFYHEPHKITCAKGIFIGGVHSHDSWCFVEEEWKRQWKKIAVKKGHHVITVFWLGRLASGSQFVSLMSSIKCWKLSKQLTSWTAVPSEICSREGSMLSYNMRKGQPPAECALPMYCIVILSISSDLPSPTPGNQHLLNLPLSWEEEYRPLRIIRMFLWVYLVLYSSVIHLTASSLHPAARFQTTWEIARCVTSQWSSSTVWLIL